MPDRSETKPRKAPRARSTARPKATAKAAVATATPTDALDTTAVAVPESTSVAAAPRVPTRDEVAQRAHELYVKSGFVHGRDLEFWLEAERQLRSGN